MCPGLPVVTQARPGGGRAGPDRASASPTPGIASGDSGRVRRDSVRPAASGIVNRSTYSVRTSTYRLASVLCYSTVPPCTALYQYVLVQTFYPMYVPRTYFFTPSTYSVRTSQYSTYLVRTEYRIHDKSTYIWNPVHLVYGGTRQFVLVHPGTYASGDMAVRETSF